MINSFQSDFVFGLQGNKYQEFIDIVAKPIIQDVVETNNYEIISPNFHLSFKDFENKKRNIASLLYTNFLNDIVRKDNIVSFKKKVCVSFDERLCNDYCPNTGRKIAIIRVAGVELAYFIFFDVKEFFTFVYDGEIDTTSAKINEIESNIQKIKPIIQQENKKELINQDCIIKIGYVHNLNIEKGFSFIHASIDGNDGFPIFYKDFPEFEKFPVGTVVKATGNFSANKFRVKEYEIGQFDDLPFSLIQEKGTLRRQEHKNFAIIETNLGNVFVSDNFIQDYEFNKNYDVECIAIEHYDFKKEKNGWKALKVLNLN